jgi:hypothetical protein
VGALIDSTQNGRAEATALTRTNISNYTTPKSKAAKRLSTTPQEAVS